MSHDTIAILDFGGQYAHLIANRVRRLGVYSVILDPGMPAGSFSGYKGIVLSGSPMSVYAPGAPRCDPEIFGLGIPVLGICYGHQLMQHLLGGKVAGGATKEYGRALLSITRPEEIFEGLPPSLRVWMSHGDSVQAAAPGFTEAARTADCAYSALFDPARRFFGVQFHPEVTHTEKGMEMLDRFIRICGAKRDWSVGQFMKEEMGRIQTQIGDKKVFLLVSGGVDSAVAFALLEKSLGSKRVYGLLVDTGLMREKEASKIQESFKKAGFKNLHTVNRKKMFLEALKGITEPERKRKIIGELFWKAKEEAAEELKLNPGEWVMGQGTIYPDTIETGGTRHADRIKTHHNRVDLVQEMIRQGKVIEPLAQLYKDEVRELGEKLGLPKSLVWRQPFPGPGLGVRILCAPEGRKESGLFKKSGLREWRAHDFSTLNRRIGAFLVKEGYLSDAEAVVLPIRSVGVQGDERTYKNPVTLFTSCLDWDALERASTAITNRFFEVNRVILSLAGRYQAPDRATAPAIRLKVSDLSEERVALLQKIDQTVNDMMAKSGKDFSIWQFPVVLIPVGISDRGANRRASWGANGRESIVLRPIVSTEAMTASFARIDWDLLVKISEKIMKNKEISHVFYDLTHKPPGTIEWE